MNWNTSIFTDRLTLRPFCEEDADFICELVNTPLWLKYIGDRNIHSKEDAIRYLQNGPIQLWNDKGYGPYVASDRVTGEKICYVGWVKRDFLDAPDMGYACLPRYFRNGYVNEANVRLLELARSAGDWKQVYSIVLPDNAASIGVLTKLGFEKHDSMIEEPEQVTVDIYKLVL